MKISIADALLHRYEVQAFRAFYNHPQIACVGECLAAKTELITVHVSFGVQAINKEVFQDITVLHIWGTSIHFYQIF